MIASCFKQPAGYRCARRGGHEGACEVYRDTPENTDRDKLFENYVLDKNLTEAGRRIAHEAWHECWRLK
jgi:hypothetical protein